MVHEKPEYAPTVSSSRNLETRFLLVLICRVPPVVKAGAVCHIVHHSNQFPLVLPLFKNFENPARTWGRFVKEIRGLRDFCV